VDDCAFGAMMSLALRPTFGKLRFQMIADTNLLASFKHNPAKELFTEVRERRLTKM
jgi:hypothetical protein